MKKIFVSCLILALMLCVASCSSNTQSDISALPPGEKAIEQIQNIKTEKATPVETNSEQKFSPVTIKKSGDSLILDDKKLVEKEVTDPNIKYVTFDLNHIYYKLDGLLINPDVYEYIREAKKEISIDNTFAKADVFTESFTGDKNQLSLHLTDISKEAGRCATSSQKKAMQTDKIYAQINYSFTSNGKPVDAKARIYVPVDGTAKVFYLIDENTIGTLPCEVTNGYCIFDRYKDGSYIICK